LSGNSFYSVEIRKGFGAGLNAFGGVKFFFSPEFSISLESSFYASFSRYKVTIQHSNADFSKKNIYFLGCFHKRYKI
jgi:hypothetical protein